MKKIFFTKLILPGLLLMSAKLTSQCITPSQYGSGTINSAAPGTSVTITTCNFGGEYCNVTFSVTGVFTFSSSVNTDYLTITNTSNSVLAFGLNPLSVSIPSVGVYRMHISASGPPACGTQNSCRTSSVFVPLPPCAGTPTAGTTNCTSTLACIGQTVGLSLSGNTTGTGITYQWQSSPNGITWTSIPSATTATSTQIISAVTFYRAIVACSTNTAASTSVSVSIVGPISYATVPFLENFDNTWQNRCDIRNVPVNTNWTSSPTKGNNSWRRQDDGLSAGWTSSTGTVAPLSGAGCANFSSYWSNGTSGNLDAYVNMGTTSNYALSFYYQNVSGTDSLELFLSTNAGTSFVKKTVYKIAGSWNKNTVNLGLVNSDSCIVRFKATGDYGNDDIAIDSLYIFTSCAIPSVTAVAAKASVCHGDSTTLTASGALTYSWSTGAVSPTISVTPSVTSMYTVTGSNGAGCSDTKIVSIVVNPVPAISISTSNTLICTGQTASLTQTGSCNTYTWNTGANTSMISVSPSITTNYTVTGTDTTSGCKNTASFTQSVSACTDIESILSGGNEVRIFPNPNNGFVNVNLGQNNFSDSFIEVYDALGKVLAKENLHKGNNLINFSKYENGIYVFKIYSNNQLLKISRVIKQ